MFAVILGLPAVPLLIMGAICARRQYLALRDDLDSVGASCLLKDRCDGEQP